MCILVLKDTFSAFLCGTNQRTQQRTAVEDNGRREDCWLVRWDGGKVKREKVLFG